MSLGRDALHSGKYHNRGQWSSVPLVHCTRWPQTKRAEIRKIWHWTSCRGFV